MLDAPAVSLRFENNASAVKKKNENSHNFVCTFAPLVSNPHLPTSDERSQQLIYDCQGGNSIDNALKCDRNSQNSGMRTLVFHYHIFASLRLIPTQKYLESQCLNFVSHQFQCSKPRSFSLLFFSFQTVDCWVHVVDQVLISRSCGFCDDGWRIDISWTDYVVELVISLMVYVQCCWKIKQLNTEF